MRTVLLIAVTFLLGFSRAHAAAYDGVVVRASDSRPIAGIVVAAFQRQPSYTVFFSGLIADIPLGRRTTDSRGTFHFDLPQPPSRLVFVATNGTMTRRRVDTSTTVIYGGGVSLKRPKPGRLNVLRLPDGDLPPTVHVAR